MNGVGELGKAGGSEGRSSRTIPDVTVSGRRMVCATAVAKSSPSS